MQSVIQLKNTIFSPPPGRCRSPAGGAEGLWVKKET